MWQKSPARESEREAKRDENAENSQPGKSYSMIGEWQKEEQKGGEGNASDRETEKSYSVWPPFTFFRLAFPPLLSEFIQTANFSAYNVRVPFSSFPFPRCLLGTTVKSEQEG